MNAHVTARAGKVPRGGRGRFPFNVQNVQYSDFDTRFRCYVHGA